MHSLHTYHSSIKKTHEASKCCFHNLFSILHPSTAEQLPSTGARSCRKSTNCLSFIGLLTLQPDPRWVEAQMDIVENCQSGDGQTSVKILLLLCLLEQHYLHGVLSFSLNSSSIKQCCQQSFSDPHSCGYCYLCLSVKCDKV